MGLPDSTEPTPLWRGPTHDEPGPAGLSYIHAGFKAPVGTQVAVVPWPLATREQVYEALADTWTDAGEYDLVAMTDAVMALLSGQPAEGGEVHQ